MIGVLSVSTILAVLILKRNEMGEEVKLGWMQVNVIWKDEKVDRRNGEISFFARCRNEEQNKRES